MPRVIWTLDFIQGEEGGVRAKPDFRERGGTSNIYLKNIKTQPARKSSFISKQVSLVGSVFSQAMESVTPEEISRAGVGHRGVQRQSSVVPEAVRQVDWPWKLMHTSTRYLARFIEE